MTAPDLAEAPGLVAAGGGRSRDLPERPNRSTGSPTSDPVPAAAEAGAGQRLPAGAGKVGRMALKTALTLGYSPCPNDTLIFYALAHGRVGAGFEWRVRLDDVEALNRSALRREIDLVKVSYHAYGHLADSYVMLASGGALGHGVGPLIVTRDPLEDLSGRRVATPGGLTTAQLLLRLSQPPEIELVQLRYDTIMAAVAKGQVDAGLIIHESRFTYPHFGLHKHLDLGEWWEGATGRPLPLGGIAARRSLGRPLLEELQGVVRESLEYGLSNRAEAEPYIAEHAQELSPEVRQRHIDLYVNEFSLELGPGGREACQALLGLAARSGLIPPLREELFLAG